MNISKIALLCGLSAAMSFAGITINVNTGNSAKKKHREDPPPPPPPPANLDLRDCNENVCCDLHVDGRTSNYSLRCNGATERVSVNVSTANGTFTEQLREGNGRLRSGLDYTSRGDLHVKAKRKPNFRTRLCDNGVCCDIDENPYNFEYTMRCDRPYDQADLLVKSNGRKEHYALQERGRFNVEFTSSDRLELRIRKAAPPPPPPPPPTGGVRRVHK